MAADRRPNKNSATEDELGLVHNLTTKLYTRHLQAMMQKILDGADVETVLGDGKLLVSAGKWASDQNSITSAAPEQDAESELNKQLEHIRVTQLENMKKEESLRKTGTYSNVVQFDDTGSEF